MTRTTFDFSTFRLPQVEFSPSQREALGRWLPLVVVAVLAWLAMRSLRRMFWTAFGLFWAFGGMHGLRHWVRVTPRRIVAAEARVRRVRACAATIADAAPRRRRIGEDSIMAMQDTIALIERYYAAFNRGDWNAMLDCLTDDVVHDLNQGPREKGRDAFRAFLGRMDSSYAEQLRDVVAQSSADGMRGAAEYVVHGTYKVSDEGLPPAKGQKYVLPGGAFFDIRDGRIARVTNYYNLQDWIAQVSR